MAGGPGCDHHTIVSEKSNSSPTHLSFLYACQLLCLGLASCICCCCCCCCTKKHGCKPKSHDVLKHLGWSEQGPMAALLPATGHEQTHTQFPHPAAKSWFLDVAIDCEFAQAQLQATMLPLDFAICSLLLKQAYSLPTRVTQVDRMTLPTAFLMTALTTLPALAQRLCLPADQVCG